MDRFKQHHEFHLCMICKEIMGKYDPKRSIPTCGCFPIWFHYDCIKQSVLHSAAETKCPACGKNRENFCEILADHGIDIPRGAPSWERSPNRYEKNPPTYDCAAEVCSSPRGRHFQNAEWTVILCLLCGSAGIHSKCKTTSDEYYVCSLCTKIDPKKDFLEKIDNAELKSQKQKYSKYNGKYGECSKYLDKGLDDSDDDD